MMIIADDTGKDDIQDMADDGKGSNVHIPSFLISTRDGYALKQIIHTQTHLNMVIL